MIAVLQRSLQASVSIDNQVKGSIQLGYVILLGIEEADSKEDIDWLANKIVNLRLFDDGQGVMNKSIIDAKGEILLISQFTLHASTKKGNRPSYIKAAKPEIAKPLYDQMITTLENTLKKPIQSGTFGANMKVSLENDGPVTIIIDTKNKK